MGHGYKGDTGHYHTIGENVGALRERFAFNENTGYFGVRGKSGKGNIRNIATQHRRQNPFTILLGMEELKKS